MNSNIAMQSSDMNELLKANMSYLYGRDPSILTYGQRPFPSEESKKNLMALLEDTREKNDSLESTEKTSNSVDSLPTQTIKVFLRMKPFPHKMKLRPEVSEAYTILDSNTLLTKMPSLDNNTSCLKKLKNSDKVCRKFFFTQTFDSNTSQLQLFEKAVKPQMIDFMEGKNSIIMSYGTSNAGKTYTLQGTIDSPGIIPRAIEFVFSNICPKDTPHYKPVNLCDIVHLSTYDQIHEMNLKRQLLACNTTEKHYHINTFMHMQQLLQEESPIRPNCKYDAHYSVWISFAEIYNETIYDLLWNDCQKKRPALKLATDSKGRTFIKGLKSICVNSGVEAYQVLMAGQYNLKVAATALNSRSSRSHCIFTIKLLKYRREQDPQSVVVSTFAFCDLAGSERLKKTLNVGDRLKEAQNINTSLFVLGRCLKTIYEAQCSSKQKIDSIGPFRESKLTRLFQRALSGKEHIALVVNVNPVPNLYMETENVLNFSAIAKRILIEPPEIIKHNRRSQTRFSRLVTQNMKADMDWENTELDDTTEVSKEYSIQDSDIEEKDEEALEDLLSENNLLKQEIKELKSSALKKDMQTRQEMANVYSDMIKDLESYWKNRLINMEEQQEDLREVAVEHIEQFYKEKLKQCNQHKQSKPIVDGEAENNNEKFNEDLEQENTHLLAKIEVLKKSIRDLKHSKDITETEKCKACFELAVAKDEAKRVNEMLVAVQNSIHNGEDAVTNYIDELQNMIKVRDERIKKMKIFLNEAKEEYIFITDQAQKLENENNKKDEILVEKNEHIQDLEEQLNQANIYSSEQNKLIEKLEEDIDHLTKKLTEAEKEVFNLSNQLSSLTLSKHNLSESKNCDKNVMSAIKNKDSLEEDKEKEISSLQKEIKKLIQINDDTVQKMETQMKHILRELTKAKDQLSDAEEKNKNLENVIHVFEIKNEKLEKNALDKQSEIENLTLQIEELTRSLHAIQHELEVFTKNRDETVLKYEDLVQSQCEDLEQERKENMRLKNLILEVEENTRRAASHKKCKKKIHKCIKKQKNKEQMVIGATDSTSDENSCNEDIKENRKNKLVTPCTYDNSVVELSESESNSSTNFKNTRRKKIIHATP